MTMKLGVWTIFHGAGAALILGTPCGRQCAAWSSLECDPSLRSSKSALAQGWNGTSSGFMSAARLWTYLPLGSQMPDRSAWPSGNRGAGAERLGLPSGVRGTAVGGTFTHCAQTGAQVKKTIATEEAFKRGGVFIQASPGSADY